MRIVSLLPAATEICFALGLGGELVGVSPECDYPSAAKDVPVLSRALVSSEDRTSSETSLAVSKALAAGDALYEVDAEGLQDAMPDVILTQGLCEVCAPSIGDVRSIAGRLVKRPRIVSLDPHTLRGMLENIEDIG